jgi:Sortase domain
VNGETSAQTDSTTDGGGAPGAFAAATPSTLPPSPEQVTPMSHPIAPTSEPTRIQIARLHIDASVVAVATDSKGALGVPDDPRVTGWWDASARPGAQTGSVVIDGHVDSALKGLGAFFDLRDVAVGDQIVVTNAVGTSTSYRVAALRLYPKSTLPAADIFAQSTSPRLVLVTCGGAFNHDTHSYLDNVVVYAVPA